MTLTITTTAAAVATAGTTFSVQASGTGFDPIGTGTLVIGAAVPVAPTITFGPAPTPTYLGGNFTVSATTNSNGARTYGRVSGPCAVVNASTGVFSSSGAGACVVQASTAATTTYLAGSAQQTVTIAPATPTITFAPAPAPEYPPNGSFTVSATTNSDGARTYSLVSGASCALTNPSAGTFSFTATGPCVVQASTAATTNFTGGSAQQTVIVYPPGFDLYAIAGTTTLPSGAAVTVWGYNSTNAAVTQPGGRALFVNQGDTVVIKLHNQLTAPTSLLVQGQDMVPDTTGVAPGATKAYTFTASRPGTYLYEAGLLPNAQHQVAMGLYGAFVVRPTGAPLQAYADSSTAFNDEAVLVLSEIDPALNSLANPASFDMRNFAPQYFLINGKAYPDTTAITSAAGNKLLLRYVNAGAKHHSMAVLGLRQNFVAKDGGLLPTLNHNVAAETLAPGQTGDAIATIPAVTSASRFAVYDGSLMLRNSSAAGFGGMLTFVTAGTGTPVTGPAVTALALTGNPQTALTATIAVSAGTVTNWQYWVDSAAPTTASITTPALTVNVAATIPVQPTGNHNLYVRGQDNLGNWGAIRSLAFAVDTTGPATSGLTLTPNPSNGTVAVALHATGDDTATGGANIAAAEYFIGATGANGTGTAMTVNTASPVASLDATLNPPVSGGVISVHSRDALGNWGPFATITLNVVSAGPTTSGVTATYSPNNGTKPLNSTHAVVRISATLTSAGSTVAGAEGFIDTVGANGTGFQFAPSDGLWNGATEAAYGDIPLATVAALSTGTHTIYVHGRDATGNWGAASSGLLVIDRTPPTVSSINRVGATTTNAANVQFTVAFSEPVTGLTNSNFTLATTGGVTGASIASITNGGATVTVSVNTGSGSGTIGLNLTSPTGATDLAGNTLASTGIPMTSAVFTIDKTPPTVSSINRSTGSTNPTNAASVTFTVTFSESVTGVTTSNFGLTTTGVPGALISGITGSGTTRTVTVSTGTGSGTIRLNKTSNAGIVDAVGNAMTAGNFTTGQTYTIDKTAPIVSSINRAAGQANPTNATTRTFTVTFSESVTGVTTANFSLTTTGSVASASITGVSGSGTTRTVTVNTGTGDGTLRLDKTSNTGIVDAAGNAMTAGNFTTGQAFTIDKTAPTVSSITRIGVSPTNATSVQFLVTFSESVTGVTTARFTLATTGVAGASITGITGSGATRTVTVNTGSGSGTIGLNKTSNTGVADTAGNTLTGGTVTGQIYSIVKP